MYLKSLCILFYLVFTANSFKYEVKVDQGIVIGTQEATVFGRKLFYGFYGIPYAQAPVKDLRFKNPKPPIKWERYYDARIEYHAACAQSHITLQHGIYGVEDCLRLNIYTPALGPSSLKPVVIWIHGHSFTSSFSHIHGGDFFIDHDVILVTVTHRIGAFGFLKLNDSDSHANMGLKDIVMALKWVKMNIKQFSGDKTKITVMGSSSAATYLSMLLMTKYSKLFSKMILQSGGIFSPSLFQTNVAEERQKLVEELAKIGQSDLLNASTNYIIRASLKIQSNINVINSQRPLVPFSPIIEQKTKRSVITQTPKEFFKVTGGANNISKPILIGFGTQESLAEAAPFLRNPFYLKSFDSYFKHMVPFSDGCKYNYTSKNYQEVSRIIKTKYFNGEITEKSIEQFLRYASHLRVFPIYEFIKTNLLVSTAPTFVYKFNYVGNFSAVRATVTAGINMRLKGAANGDELCYLLKCEPYWESYVQTMSGPGSHDKQFIKEITELWANFAKTGNPTLLSYSGNVTWPPMTTDVHNILLIGKVNKLINAKEEDKMFRFWNQIYEDYYANEHCDTNKRDEL